MAKSAVPFQRWTCREESTWPFQMFQKYSEELDRFLAVHFSASRFVYSSLGKNGAAWPDLPTAHFTFDVPYYSQLFDDLKAWSRGFNDFGNWVRLNAIIAMTSNLETYVASVITVALESDPGLLLGASRSVDGASLLKHGAPPLNIHQHIDSCTRGDWSSRASHYKRLFGNIPEIITKKMSDLESIRRLRNRVGHAFGRDIAQARKHGVKTMLPMERISPERTMRYQRVVWAVAKQLDVHLLSAHIGEYQAIRFYHVLSPGLNMAAHPSERAMKFKKEIGRFKAETAGKLFAKQLVAYYDAL